MRAIVQNQFGQFIDLSEISGSWITASTDQVALGTNTARLPSATRPTLVVAVCGVLADTANDSGTIELRVQDANPPTTVVDQGGHLNNMVAANTQVEAKVVGLVPAGFRYGVYTVTLVGSPVFSLRSIREYAL